MVSGARIRGGERKAERDHERENRHRAASGLPSLEEERAAAAREEAHVRREREKSVASRNRRQRKNVQLAKRRWHMGEVTGDALRSSSPERFEVLYCLHYAAMPERKRIQDLTMTG